MVRELAASSTSITTLMNILRKYKYIYVSQCDIHSVYECVSKQMLSSDRNHMQSLRPLCVCVRCCSKYFAYQLTSCAIKI